MATDHRGRPLHAGKRTVQESGQPRGRSDLPRLSMALSDLLNNSIEYFREEYGPDAQDEYMMHHSIPFYGETTHIGNHIGGGDGGFDEGVSEIDTAEMLRRYRDRRNAGMDVESGKEDIRDAYKER